MRCGNSAWVNGNCCPRFHDTSRVGLGTLLPIDWFRAVLTGGRSERSVGNGLTGGNAHGEGPGCKARDWPLDYSGNSALDREQGSGGISAPSQGSRIGSGVPGRQPGHVPGPGALERERERPRLDPYDI